MSLLFKIAGLAVIFAVCTFTGFLKSANIKRRSQKLGCLYRSVSLFGERVKSDGSEISRILPQSFNNNLVYINNGEIGFNTDYLLPEDIALISEFLSDLGLRDKDSEYERICLFAKLIGKQKNEAEERAQSLCKLYNTVGILSGLFICIFFI